jgi:hypothetical protein
MWGNHTFIKIRRSRMKKSPIAFVLTASLAFAPLALAKNAPDPLADVIAGGCSYVQIAPFGTSLLASWSWENGTSQTKFGGDAEYAVSLSPDGGANWYDYEIEFELVQYVPGTLASDYPGELVYRCSNDQTLDTGSCNGSVLGLRDAVMNAALEALNADLQTNYTAVDIGANIQASREGVNVKAMNPGGHGRQNYPLVDVCDVPVL